VGQFPGWALDVGVPDGIPLNWDESRAMSGKPLLVDSFGIDKDLVLEFLCAFSRFEYGLKRAGFARGNASRVKADWDCFGKTLRTLSTEQCAPVLRSCAYILQEPPKKQVLRDGHLAWSAAADTSVSDIERVLIYVRRVRNNLFHGGKFPVPDGPVEEVARNTKLLQDALAVLIAVLDLPGVETVRENFAPDGN